MSVKNIYDYHTMTQYIIERRNTVEPGVDREFCYEISSDNTISLIETTVMKLKENGKNDDLVVSFLYNIEKYATEVELKTYAFNRKIKIKYGVSSQEFEKRIMKFLFSINGKDFCKIIPVLEWLYTNLMSVETSTFSITSEVDEELFSEIDVVEGMVKYYMTTKIKSESETEIIKRICSSPISEFLKDNLC